MGEEEGRQEMVRLNTLNDAAQVSASLSATRSYRMERFKATNDLVEELNRWPAFADALVVGIFRYTHKYIHACIFINK